MRQRQRQLQRRRRNRVGMVEYGGYVISTLQLFDLAFWQQVRLIYECA